MLQRCESPTFSNKHSVETDRTVGAELHKNAPEMLAYDFDLVVPKMSGSPGPKVAVGFDRQRLVQCCGTVANFLSTCDETRGSSAQMALTTPQSHQASVKGLLSFLLPVPSPGPASFAEACDVASVADYLSLDAEHSDQVQKWCIDKLQEASLKEVLDMRMRCSEGLDAPMRERIQKLVNEPENMSELVDRASKLSLDDLHVVLHCENLTEDEAWAVLSRWWSQHGDGAWPKSQALAQKDLDRSVRWHAMSDELFAACANHGCLSWRDADAWGRIRRLLSSLTVLQRQSIEVSVGGKVFMRRRDQPLPYTVCKDPKTGKLEGGHWGNSYVDGHRVYLADKFTVNEHSDHVTAHS